MKGLSSLRRHLERGNRPLRFIVAGVLNTVFGVALYPLLILVSPWLKQHYVLTLMIAQAASISFAYMTYKVALRGSDVSLRQLGFFSSFYLLHCVSNIVVLPILVELLHVNPIVAQFSFIIVMAIGGYLWHSRLTFATSRNPEAQTPS